MFPLSSLLLAKALERKNINSLRGRRVGGDRENYIAATVKSTRREREIA